MPPAGTNLPLQLYLDIFEHPAPKCGRTCVVDIVLAAFLFILPCHWLLLPALSSLVKQRFPELVFCMAARSFLRRLPRALNCAQENTAFQGLTWLIWQAHRTAEHSRPGRYCVPDLLEIAS